MGLTDVGSNDVLLILASSLGAANLCFAHLWYAILDTRPAQYYALRAAGGRGRLVAAIANVVTLGAIIAAIRTSSVGDHGVIGTAAGFALGLVILLQCTALYKSLYASSRRVRVLHRAAAAVVGRRLPGRVGLAGILATSAACLVIDSSIRVVIWQLIDLLGLATLPAVPVIFGLAAWYAVHGHPVNRGWHLPGPSHRESQRPPSAASSPLCRVVWIIFDELDYGVAFDRRPETVTLPGFDTLEATSLSCIRAYPPAHCTQLSIPALLTGIDVVQALPVNPYELRLESRDAVTSIMWSEQPNVFTRVREIGGRCALVGYYHPYGRILGKDLDAWSWRDDRVACFSARESFCGAYIDHFRGLVETGRYSPLGQSLAVRKSVSDFLALRARATAFAADRTLNLVFLHLPVPHTPYFFDRRRGTYDAANRGAAGYLDNLTLADGVLREIVATLEPLSEAAPTSIIVSSDHWWRASAAFDGTVDRRVPLIVKVAGCDEPVVVDECLNTLGTAELVLALVKGDVRSHREAARYITVGLPQQVLHSEREGGATACHGARHGPTSSGAVMGRAQ